MSRRPDFSVRCDQLIDASETVVQRALRASDTWIRAARAVGGQFEVAGSSSDLASAGLVRFRSRRGAPSVLLRVTMDDGMLTLESAIPHGRPRIRIELTVASTATGTLARVEFVVRTSSMLHSTVRAVLVRYGEMLLGIATLVAREPVRVVAGAVISDGTVLLARRKSPSTAAGKWELPGGKVEPGETDQQALQRELLEELALHVEVFGRIGPLVEVQPGLQLLCYRAEMTGDQAIRLVDHDQYRWFGPDQLESVELLESDRQLIDSLRTALQN